MTDSFNESIGNRDTFPRDNIGYFDSSSVEFGNLLSRTPETQPTTASAAGTGTGAASRIMRHSGDASLPDVATNGLLLPQFSESKLHSDTNPSFCDGMRSSSSSRVQDTDPYVQSSGNNSNPTYTPATSSSKYGMSLFNNMSNPSDFSDPSSLSFLPEDNNEHSRDSLQYGQRDPYPSRLEGSNDHPQSPTKKDSMSTLSPSSTSTPPPVPNDPSSLSETNETNISSIFRQKNRNPNEMQTHPNTHTYHAPQEDHQQHQSHQQQFLMYSTSQDDHNLHGMKQKPTEQEQVNSEMKYPRGSMPDLSMNASNGFMESFDFNDADKFLMPLDSFGNDRDRATSASHHTSSNTENEVNSHTKEATIEVGPIPNEQSDHPIDSQHHKTSDGVEQEEENGHQDAPEGDGKQSSMGSVVSREPYISNELSFYAVLRLYRKAFVNFTFLLPGLSKQISMDKKGSQMNFVDTLDTDEVIIVERRLRSAVCAFGGVLGQGNYHQRSNVSSIFRTKGGPHSNALTGPPKKKPWQIKYEQQLPLRYYDNENRLSWEVEEDPPVEIDENEGIVNSRYGKSYSEKRMIVKKESTIHVKTNEDLDPSDSSREKSGRSFTSLSTNSSASEQSKAKYKCKLCGQPKQNHICPYRQSLQRSIGTMSYPALNAHIAHEPGKLSTPLSEMNNFFTMNEEDEDQSSVHSPARVHRSTSEMSATVVTPEHSKLKIAAVNKMDVISTQPGTSTGSPISISSSISSEKRDNAEGKKNEYVHTSETKRRKTIVQTPKERYVFVETKDLIIEETMEMRPEQYRLVPSATGGNYQYPVTPLTYGQRKGLSDCLYTHSQEVPGLTDECAKVLSRARETDAWDLAVAELMAQIIVVIHCKPAIDRRAEGLRQYLCTLGISC